MGVLKPKWILIIGQVVASLVLWTTFGARVIPTPLEIFRTFPVIWNKGVMVELWSSFLVNGEALILAFGLSLLIAYSTALPGRYGFFFRPIATFVSKLRFLSLVGLTFVFTILTSSGHQLKVALLVFGITVFLTTSMVDVVCAIPKERFNDARTLRMNEWRTMFEVVVLGTFANALDAFRQCAAMAFMMLTMVEGLVRSGGGIGVMLLTADKYMKLPEIFAIQAMILVIGLLFDGGIALVRRLACPYAYMTLERK